MRRGVPTLWEQLSADESNISEGRLITIWGGIRQEGAYEVMFSTDWAVGRCVFDDAQLVCLGS